jgi:hypothetical protein
MGLICYNKLKLYNSIIIYYKTHIHDNNKIYIINEKRNNAFKNVFGFEINLCIKLEN